MIVPAPNIVTCLEVSVAAPLWQEFPSAVVSEQPNQPSTDRKRPGSISCVSLSICARTWWAGSRSLHRFGRTVATRMGGGTERSIWQDAVRLDTRFPLAGGMPPRRGGTLSAHLHYSLEEPGGTPLTGNAAGDGHETKCELSMRSGFSRDGARGRPEFMDVAG